MNLEQLCGNFKTHYMPLFHIHKPADFRTNPYTKEPMQAAVINFPENAIDAKGLKKWMTNNCPNYSQTLKTEVDYTEFNAEEGIHKVYLFSSKDKPSPIYLALTNHFRNRVRFAFVAENSEVAVGLA